MTLTPIAIAVDAYAGLFGNPPAYIRAHAERIAQLKARAFDLALQEALRIERDNWTADKIASREQDLATLRGEVGT